MVMGPQDPPPIHADALETVDVTPQDEHYSFGKVKVENNPYGFYEVKQGPWCNIQCFDKDMTMVYDGQRGFCGDSTILIKEAKAGLGFDPQNY